MEPAAETDPEIYQDVPSWGHLDEDGNKTYPLHPAQGEAVFSPRRFTAAIAGTGGGKTAIGPVWITMLINKILASRDVENEPILGLVVAPTYSILARATAPTLVQMFKDTDLEGRYVPSQNRYYLPNGWGVIWLLGADNPAGLEGGQFDFAWVDEGGQLKYDAWIAIQGRTGQKEAPVLITTTPYGENWLFHKFFKLWLAGDPDYLVVQWSSKDNPAYPDREYERAKRSMGKERAAQRYDGQFVRLTGLVYPDLSSCVVPDEAPPTGWLVGGMDFGWNNPYAALAGTVYVTDEGLPVLYVHDERYKRECTNADHAKRLPKGHMWWADPSAPEAIKVFQKEGHKVRKGKNAIIPGIDQVNALIYGQQLKVSEACVALLAEGGLYCYPQKDDEVQGDKPVAENDHAMDALRYLIAGAYKRMQRKLATAA